MKRTLCTLLATALLAAPLAASAAGYPTDIHAADGVTRFPYGGATPTIVCAPLFVCDLTLASGETIENLAIGDSVRWIVSPAQSGSGPDGTPHVLIKPTDVNLATNLLVTTTKHTYNVNLRSAKSGSMERVGFSYPADPARVAEATPTAAPAPSATPSPEPTPSAALDYNYHVVGDKWLTPAEIYNDGTHTYVRYATLQQRLPALLQLGPNGYELINYRVTDGKLFIVDGLPAQIALVSGTGKAQTHITITHN